MSEQDLQNLRYDFPNKVVFVCIISIQNEKNTRYIIE